MINLEEREAHIAKALTVNHRLADSLSVSHDTRVQISRLHFLRSDIYKFLEKHHKELDCHQAEYFNIFSATIERELQVLWKFPVDGRRFKFWELPGCVCPKYDNYDRYPYGNYVFNKECKFHGNSVYKKTVHDRIA